MRRVTIFALGLVAVSGAATTTALALTSHSKAANGVGGHPVLSLTGSSPRQRIGTSSPPRGGRAGSHPAPTSSAAPVAQVRLAGGIKASVPSFGVSPSQIPASAAQALPGIPPNQPLSPSMSLPGWDTQNAPRQAERNAAAIMAAFATLRPFSAVAPVVTGNTSTTLWDNARAGLWAKALNNGSIHLHPLAVVLHNLDYAYNPAKPFPSGGGEWRVYVIVTATDAAGKAISIPPSGVLPPANASGVWQVVQSGAPVRYGIVTGTVDYGYANGHLVVTGAAPIPAVFASTTSVNPQAFVQAPHPTATSPQVTAGGMAEVFFPGA